METNVLYYGDNLEILRKYIPDNSIDLIYLDPPFNSKATYHVLFKEPTGKPSQAQSTAFEDTWHWTSDTTKTFQEIIASVTTPSSVKDMMKAFVAFIGTNDMMAYLTMMCIRLLELKRVLKDTGSIYLHCDPTASHYLKMVLDTIFGRANFRNEIIWHYRKWATGWHYFQRNHDVVLFYSKSNDEKRVFNRQFMPRATSTLKRFGTATIVSGHDPQGRRLPSKVEDRESPGVAMDDVWDIGRVPPIKQLFPTEKPQTLLERIIYASSNEGDLVLDPFCGCGTALVEAHKLNRRWIGIDITHLAIAITKRRLEKAFLDIKYKVVGEPVDLAGVKEVVQALN